MSGTTRICLILAGWRSMPIRTPLGNIAKHIMKAPIIRRFVSHRAMSGTSLSFIRVHEDPRYFEDVSVAAFPFACTACVLPFRLRGQAIFKFLVKL